MKIQQNSETLSFSSSSNSTPRRSCAIYTHWNAGAQRDQGENEKLGAGVGEACRKSLIPTCMDVVYMWPLIWGLQGSLFSPSPLISAEPGQVQHEPCSSIRTSKTHILLFGVILSLLQSRRIITAPLPPKIVHILISGTWEHQDMSELTMLREGCLPGPCGWALRAPRGWVLRAHRGEDKVKREARTRVMLPPNQKHWAAPGSWQRQEGASTGVFRGNWVHRHLDIGRLGPRHER